MQLMDTVMMEHKEIKLLLYQEHQMVQQKVDKKMQGVVQVRPVELLEIKVVLVVIGMEVLVQELLIGETAAAEALVFTVVEVVLMMVILGVVKVVVLVHLILEDI